MTAAERKLVRRALMTAGFVRVGATFDDGDGKYAESWRAQDGTTIEINWEKRTG